jgi:hypothetical protein
MEHFGMRIVCEVDEPGAGTKNAFQWPADGDQFASDCNFPVNRSTAKKAVLQNLAGFATRPRCERGLAGVVSY